jgi:VWFA-related protein
MRCILGLAVAVCVSAQDPRFGVQSRLVLVPATVTGANGRAVDGLETNDFVVLDNGRPQKAAVDTIGTGVAPIALIVAIQSSGISRAVLEKVHKVGAMIQPLVTGERGCAGVVSFSDRIVWLQECTHDEDALAQAFERVRPGAAKVARLTDTVSESVERLRQRPKSRRVLLLISESRDRGSETELEQAAMAAQAAGVTVYAATYSAFTTAFTTKNPVEEPKMAERPKKPSDDTGTVTGAPPTCGPFGCTAAPLPPQDQRVDLLGGIGELIRLGKTNTTQVLTQATGGAAFPFTRLKGLENAIQKLGAELHSQYLLSFTPDDSTAGYHRLEVRVTEREARVRARPGYWSTQERSSDAPERAR